MPDSPMGMPDELQRPNVRQYMWYRLLVWLVLAPPIALLPIVFRLLFYIMKEQPVQLHPVLGHGELFLVSIGLITATLPGLLRFNTRFTAYRILLVSLGMLIIMVSTVLFATTAARQNVTAPETQFFTDIMSLFVFVSAIAYGACSTVISGTEE